MAPQALTLGSLLSAGAVVVTTVAGSGPRGVGDGLPAMQAVLTQPVSVTAGSDGSIYIVDMQDHRIRRIRTDGVIETFAGTGAAEGQDLGDGGPATSASLRFPRNAVFGADGALYVADSNHYVIRRIDPSGLITTVAGNRNSRYEGDGTPATRASFAFPSFVIVDSAGNMYISDQEAQRVRKVGTDGVIRTIAGTGDRATSGDGGPALSASINSPGALALDSSERVLFISTRDGVRRVELATSLISTLRDISGGGHGLGADNRNGLYLVGGSRVQRMSLDTGGIQTVAGGGPPGFGGDGGPATQAQFNDVRGVFADSAGNLYLADTGNQRVRKIGLDSRISTIAGGASSSERVTEGNALDVVVYDSQGLAFDAFGNLFFADFPHHVIRKLDRAGRVTTVVGDGRQTSAGDGGHPKNASFSNGLALVFDKRGNLFFLDLTQGPAVVRRVSPGADGVIDATSDERIITVAGRVSSRENADHGAADGGPGLRAVFNAARGIALDSLGNLYIADVFDNRLRKVVPGTDGVLNGEPDEIITTISGNGREETTGDGGPADRAGLQGPVWVSADRADNLYIVQGAADRRIRRIDARSNEITTFGFATPGKTVSLCIDTQDNVVFGDNTRFYRIEASTRAKSAIAGTGESGFSGDGGDPLQATFAGIMFCAVDASGDLDLADNGNFRIRRIGPLR